MKRIIGLVTRPLWRISAPVRRPLAARLDGRVHGLSAASPNIRLTPPIVEALAGSSKRLERLEERLERVDRAASNMVEEADLVFNGLSREIFRLQAQVEMLQKRLEGMEKAGQSDDPIGLEPGLETAR
jgi:hypothetical protein